MKVIKFGGKSLGNDDAIDNVVAITQKEINANKAPLLVVSALGKTTDRLLELIKMACSGEEYSDALNNIKTSLSSEIDFSSEIEELSGLLKGISLLRECTPKTSDAVLSFGERIAAKTVAARLNKKKIKAIAVDAGDLLVTDSDFGNASILSELSLSRTKEFFASFPSNTTPVVTGFIARDMNGNRTTLGRNGSNYTAALLANYLEASILDNYTHVDGIYTAHPDIVVDALKIKELNYSEAEELSQFGANILHYKTIMPLREKNIPLRILNSFHPNGIEQEGTLVSNNPSATKGITALATLRGKALIHFEGYEMKGKSGIDARIFTSLQKANISVSMVTQVSSERGMGIVVDEQDAENAVAALSSEFALELSKGLTSELFAEHGLSVVALIGVDLAHLDRPYSALVRHQVTPRLISNAIPNNTLCLLIKSTDVPLALNIIHGELFHRERRIHIAIVGHGTVGGVLIDKLIQQRYAICSQKALDLRIFAIANSKRLLLDKEGIGSQWRYQMESASETTDSILDIIRYAQEHHLENTIFVDNTASEKITNYYFDLVENGFDLVSSNKIFNIGRYDKYSKLRKLLSKNRKSYRYEANVGAGLPLIENLQLLHLSGDKIIAIRGLFSGSLSHIFSLLSEGVDLKTAVVSAIKNGYTEPNPVIDLSGIDVARKVLILARELDIPCEMEDIEVQNLVPSRFATADKEMLIEHIDELEKDILSNSVMEENQHLQYVGELIISPDTKKAKLSCKVQSIDNNSALGRVKGADSCFEIYTESYGSLPMVIQGAGAGANVTAHGVFGDILRTAERRIYP